MRERHAITPITIRRLTEADEQAVADLAGRDTRSVPNGELLGALVEGRLLAAVSLDTDEHISDPFLRTAELRELLELRAGQVGESSMTLERSHRQTRRFELFPVKLGRLSRTRPNRGLTAIVDAIRKPVA